MIEIPAQCPSCNSQLITVNMQLFCKNKDCPAQTLKRIQHFCKVMKIKGMGEKTLEKLDFETISDLYDFSKQHYITALGEKMGAKLYQEVHNSVTVPLNVGLAAFSIPLIGETAARKLATVCKDITDIDNISCKEAGLGEKATAHLLNWLETKEHESLPINTSFEGVTSTKQSVSNGVVVCISGKLTNYKNRSDAAAYLESLGCQVVDSITKATTHLISEDGKTSSAKYKSAQERNITICSIDELVNTL